MKKITAILFVLILCLSLGACKFIKTDASDATEDNCYYVYIGMETPVKYTVDLTKVEVTEGAFSVLSYLKETEGITFTYQVGAYGAYITAVGDLTAEGSSYIALYTTYDEDKDLPGPYTTEKVVDGKTFVTAGVGASSMHVVGGQSIYLTLETY